MRTAAGLSSNAGRVACRRDGKRPSCGCFGCLGVAARDRGGVSDCVCSFLSFSFRLGDHRTTLGRWEGVGTLRDSAGFDYGLFMQFGPQCEHRLPHRDRQLCATVLQPYWEGAGLHDRGHTASFRHGRPDFRCVAPHRWQQGVDQTHGARASEIAAALRVDGRLARPEPGARRSEVNVHEFPARWQSSYTSPVPERHARVTLARGNLGDFESMCGSLRSAAEPRPAAR